MEGFLIPKPKLRCNYLAILTVIVFYLYVCFCFIVPSIRQYY